MSKKKALGKKVQKNKEDIKQKKYYLSHLFCFPNPFKILYKDGACRKVFWCKVPNKVPKGGVRVG